MCGKAAGLSLSLKRRHGQRNPAVAKKVAGNCGYVPLRNLPVVAMDEARGGQSSGCGFQEDQRVVAVLRLHHGHDAAEAGVVFQHVARFGGQYSRFYVRKRAEPRTCRAKCSKGQRIKSVQSVTVAKPSLSFSLQASGEG